jgi:hypothetical protein
MARQLLLASLLLLAAALAQGQSYQPCSNLQEITLCPRQWATTDEIQQYGWGPGKFMDVVFQGSHTLINTIKMTFASECCLWAYGNVTSYPITYISWQAIHNSGTKGEHASRFQFETHKQHPQLGPWH